MHVLLYKIMEVIFMTDKIITQNQFYVKKEYVDDIIKPKIQGFNALESNLLFKVYFFDKKKHISECVLDFRDIEKCIERINKSKLVVFNVKQIEKNILIRVLSNLTVLRKHYSPIVEVGDSKVFFFPQLNYSDIYLLIALFQQKYVNETIKINLGIDANIE